MEKIASFLMHSGFQILNLSYPSTKETIEDIVETIHPEILAFSQNVTKVHFVGHSMGGLVIRAYLHRYFMTKVGRVVFLGTPNRGNELADFMHHWWLYKMLFGPAGQQLITGYKASKEPLVPINYELGIIAGYRRIGPPACWLTNESSDGIVSITSTKIDGMKDHIIISTGHIMLLFDREVWKQTLSFLKYGQFKHKKYRNFMPFLRK
jgi:pimeloyl-ACP methyl ester carboxylesterase